MPQTHVYTKSATTHIDSFSHILLHSYDRRPDILQHMAISEKGVFAV